MARIEDLQARSERPIHSEAIYRSLVEKSFDAIVVLQDAKIQFANLQAARVLGYTPEEAQQLEFRSKPNAYLSVVPPEFRVDVQQGIEAALHGSNSREQVEYRLTGKGGKTVNVEARFKPIDYKGRPALLLVLRDITERKRTEIVEKIRKELSRSANEEFLLNSVVERSRRLLHSDLACLSLLDEESGKYFLLAISGEASKALKGVELRLPIGLSSQLVQTRETVYVPNYFRSIAFRDLDADAILKGYGVRSMLAVPLTVATQVVGALAVFSRRDVPFSKEDRELLHKLADCAAAAIENTRLISKQEQMSLAGASLLEIGRAISSTLDLEQLLKIVAHKTAAACRADRCSVFYWSEDGRVDPLMSQFASAVPDSGLWAAFKDLKRYRVEDVPAFAQAIEQRDAVVIDNVTEIPLVPREWVEVFQLKSLLVVPLLRHDQVVGALMLDNTYGRRSFEDEQVQLASTIASQITLAIENARLFQVTRRRLQESETLLGVSRSMSSTLDITELIRLVAREATRALGADSAAAYRYDPEREVLHPLAAYHLPAALRSAMREVPVAVKGFPFLEEAWRTKQAVFSNDTPRDRRCESRLLRRFPQRSTLFVPMVVKEEIMGGLFLFWWEREHRFTSAELRLVDGIARQAGMALENARLFSELKRSNTTLEESTRTVEELYRLSAALQESSSPSERLDLILRGAHEVAGLDRILLFLADTQDCYLRAVASVGDVDEPLERVWVPLDSRGGTLAKVFLDRRAIRVDPEGPLPPELRLSSPYSHIKWLRSRSFLVLPLISRNKAIGVIAMDNKSSRRPLPQNLELLPIFANHAATAIENARLYENEKTAREESVKRAAELAAHKERNRLAGTLHDSLAQTLFSLGLNLDWCLHHLPGPADVIKRISDAKQLVGSVMAQVRKLIYEFSEEGDTLRKGDPSSVLRALVDDFKRLSGMSGQVELKGAFHGIDPKTMTILYRSIQEALVNVVKHSNATQALLAVQALDGVLRFEVADDGHGRAAQVGKRAAQMPDCFGLQQMRERLAEGGGTLSIEDNTPRGLRLIGTLPIAVARHEIAR
ncbi:MAG: GAF domain-containing protein [Candidatus Rokubacteria bacterium]|nr:GAF domain-containing protein [Candidatus Rokubacteria bacterium]